MEAWDSTAAEQRRAREEQRLAMGRLTEGVAHVVRNPLTGIGAGVELLGRFAPEDSLARENVAAILREVDRVNGLLEEMLRITHPPELARSPVDLPELLSRAATDGARVQGSAPSQGGLPLLDAEQLRQALAELVRNAHEAAGPGGEVRIRAAAERGPDRTSLRIDIENSGAAFPDHILAHAFEPFRTTKPGRKGVGLYVAHDIVERHGGRLRLESRPGGGARVTLHLPWETEHDRGN